MLHSRKDYNRIQDPLNLIGTDEPVFLLRAKDSNMIRTLIHYRDLVTAGGDDYSTKLLVESIEEHISRVRNWQAWKQGEGVEIRRATMPDEVEMQRVLDAWETVKGLHESNENSFTESIQSMKEDNEFFRKNNNSLNFALKGLNEEHENLKKAYEKTQEVNNSLASDNDTLIKKLKESEEHVRKMSKELSELKERNVTG